MGKWDYKDSDGMEPDLFRCAHCNGKYTYIYCPDCKEVAYCDQNCQRLNAEVHAQEYECIGRKRGKKKKKRIGKRGRRKISKVMREYYHGKLHSGSKRGPLVRRKKQALAIAYAEARRRQRGR